MNIKQVELITGVTRQNIRFYEKQGLLSPDRDPENDYRKYTEDDVHTLKCIRVMRMLDMPLDDIREVLHGDRALSDAALSQQQRLEDQAQKLDEAIRFCGILREKSDIKELDVDACLNMMQNSSAKSFFQQWKEDYKAFSKAEHRRYFTFIPDTPVTNAREFTDALFAYAADNNVDTIVTKESMYPIFTIDGIEYTAERNYGAVGYGSSVPVANIRCKMTHPEEYAPAISEKRTKLMRMLHIFLPGLILFAIFFLTMIPSFGGLKLWEILFLIVSTLAMVATESYLLWFFRYNDKTKF